MTTGRNFNAKLTSLETATNKIEHFKKSATAPAAAMNAVNIEDNDSDYEIKLWLDPSDKTAYYYAEPEKVYLNEDSSKMFFTGTFLPGSHKDIKDLDLSNFNTSKVTDMYGMFAYMHRLTSLDLSNFNTSNVTDMSDMFKLRDGYASGDQLGTIYVKNDFDTTKLTNDSNMFKNRKTLRGGAGSYLADPSTADKSWLRIDDPAHGRPGYFTRKP